MVPIHILAFEVYLVLNSGEINHKCFIQTKCRRGLLLILRIITRVILLREPFFHSSLCSKLGTIHKDGEEYLREAVPLLTRIEYIPIRVQLEGHYTKQKLTYSK